MRIKQGIHSIEVIFSAQEVERNAALSTGAK